MCWWGEAWKRGRGGEGRGGEGIEGGEPSELCAVLELFTINQLQVYPCLLGVVHIACTYVRILARLYWDILG